MTRIALIAVVAAVAAAAGLAVAFVAGDGGDAPEFRGSRPPDGITAPQFALRDYQGRTVTMRGLRGKAVGITFLDTQCEEACPVIARQVADGLALLGPDDRRRVAVYAITVDPAEDTVPSVRAFLRNQRAERALGYLIGPESLLPGIWRAFDVLPSVETGRDDMHSAPVRIFDARGRWVSTLHAGIDLTPENLAHDLRAALAASS